MEESTMYFLLAGCFALFLGLVTYFGRKETKVKADDEEEEEIRRGQAGQGVRQPINRAAAQRARNRRAQIRDSDSEPDPEQRNPEDSDDEKPIDERLLDPKLGAKKRAKLEAKAEKKAQRESEEIFRKKKKAEEAKSEEERRKKEEEEALEEKRKLQEEEKARQEKAQRELEEYMKLKEAFSVEEEGCEVVDEDEEKNLIELFINHIKDNKVILFEELATHFNLKVPDAIDRLTTLVNEGRLTGVMDDRGKFIYISEEELKSFSKFIKQRGRVSIAELVENSSSIINLIPEVKAADGC